MFRWNDPVNGSQMDVEERKLGEAWMKETVMDDTALGPLQELKKRTPMIVIIMSWEELLVVDH